MTRKNQFELVTANFNDKEKPVWVSFLRNLFVCVMHNSQFQQPVTTRLSEFQQPGRTSFELVTTSFNHKEKWFELVTASFNQAVRTRKNSLFVCVMHNSQFQQQEQPVFELVSTTRKNQFWASHTTSFNHKEKWFELVTASFNKQWEPGRTSLS